MPALMIYPLGETALVLQSDISQQSRLIRLVRQFENQRKGAPLYQLILGVGNLTLRFNPLQQSAAVALAWLQERWALAESANEPIVGQLHEIAVRYGGEVGPDLADVAQHCGLSIAQVIEAHAEPIYDVLCIGFLPGFPYLAGLPEALHTPRQASPRAQVPAGSVGIGGAQTGIYPCASPGGWQLIGQTSLRLFDAVATSPCRLQAGDQVRFIPQGKQ